MCHFHVSDIFAEFSARQFYQQLLYLFLWSFIMETILSDTCLYSNNTWGIKSDKLRIWRYLMIIQRKFAYFFINKPILWVLIGIAMLRRFQEHPQLRFLWRNHVNYLSIIIKYHQICTYLIFCWGSTFFSCLTKNKT